jgi:mRNA interferase RelE/StbE
MNYHLVIQKRVLKTLEKMSEPDFSKVKTAILKLADTPRPVGYKKLKNRPGYRIRVGDYRIIYEIRAKELIIEVIHMAHRRKVYD